jgi:hypothetical protein
MIIEQRYRERHRTLHWPATKQRADRMASSGVAGDNRRSYDCRCFIRKNQSMKHGNVSEWGGWIVTE